MQKNETSIECRASKVRKLPVLFSFTAGILLKKLSTYGEISFILSGLAWLFLAASAFLLFIAVYHKIMLSLYETEESDNTEDGFSDMEIIAEENQDPLKQTEICSDAAEDNSKKNPSAEPKQNGKIKSFFSGLFPNPNKDKVEPTEKTPEIKSEKDAGDAEQMQEDELVEIQKVSSSAENKTGSDPKKSKFEVFAAILYLATLFAGLLWYICRMPAISPLSYEELYDYGIIHTVLLLVFPCISFIYLKIRKNEGEYPCDKTSYGLLTMLSYVSMAYASVIAISAVLDINILVILPWVNRAATYYIAAAIGINAMISIMKHNIIGDFNYQLLPVKSGTKIDSFLDSEDMKTNFSLKSLWTIKYALNILPGFVLLLGLILLLSTSVYVVQPHQQAAVYRFGKLSENSITGEGLHLKFPWPVDKIAIYDVERVNAMQIGYESSNTTDFLWDQKHDGGEYTLLLGNGNEAVSVNIKLMYKIDDLYTYIKTTSNPEAVLSAAAYEAMMTRTINTTLDSFLTVDRTSLSDSVAAELTEFCKSEGLGLTVTQVTIESIHPPVEVANVYQKVVTASVDKNTIIIRAKASAAEQLISAEQEGKTVIDYAKAQQFSRVSNAQKEMAVYYAAMEAYKINPDCFKLTKYLDTYQTMIRGNKVYVFSPGTEDDMSNIIIGKNTFVIPKN